MTAKNDFNYLIKLMFATGRLIRKRTEKGQRPDLLSVLQLETLAYIKEEKPLMKEVADYLCITPPSATSLINKLVKAGMIKRVSDKQDRRIIRLQITAKGEIKFKQEFKKVSAHIKRVLEKLNKKERENLAKILEKLQKAYRQ
jgi:DNA-binding MarR family transcriptional regulator